MKSNYYIKKLWFTGPGIEESAVEFINGLNIIHGANDTGKSWILDSFDFMCGLDHDKFVIDESTGCDTVHLEVETPHGSVKMERKLGSTKIQVDSTDPRIESHQYTAGKSKYWINSVWMTILGIDEDVKVIKNENAVRQSLTLRSFLNLMCVPLENINRRQSVFYTSGGPFSKTAMKSTLLYFLNEEEFKEYKEKTGTKQKNVEKKIRTLVKNESLEYLSELKLEVKREILSPEQVREKIAVLMQQINDAQSRMSEATEQRRKLSEEIVAMNEEMKSASLMKHRYQILRGQYHSDIKRITFIIDGEQKLKDLKEPENSGKYALSSIVFCGHCGDVFQRTHWSLPSGKTIVWRCVSRLRKKTSGIDCPARTVTEADLHKVIVTAVNQALDERDSFLPALKESVGRALSSTNSGLVAEVDAKLEKLQKELLKKANAKQAFDSIADQIEDLREEKRQLLLEDATNEGVMQKVRELEEFIDSQGGPVTEYDEALVRRLIEKVTVYDDHFTVEFKSGLETDVMI